MCPVCGCKLEPDFYLNGFHPVENYICPECGYETQMSEEEKAKLFKEEN